MTDSTFQFAGDPRFKTTGRDARPGERWPPNLLFSHLPECDETACAEGCAVAELDRQSGQRTSRGVAREARHTTLQWAVSHPDATVEPQYGTEIGYGDTGGASRFFPVFRYQAKASRAERDAGLDDLPLYTAAELTGRAEGSAGLSNPRASTTGRPRHNTHPTVKALGLMAWLVRLITPPGGLVLDPFAGSGTTGVAAVTEGMRFLGIEREAEYVEIARRRIASAQEEHRA